MPVYNEDGVEVVTSAAASGITVKEVDGSPSVTATIIRFPNGTLTDDGGGQVTYAAAAGVAFAVLADQKAQNTGGGTFTAGAWRTRDLNTEVSDASGIVTISANRFTPISGTYYIHAQAPATDLNTIHQARLYNYTGAATVLTGNPVVIQAASTGETISSVIMGIFTANGTDAYVIEDYCTLDATFGTAGNITTEVYTQVTLIKIP